MDDLLTSAWLLAALAACLLNGVAAVRWQRPYRVLPVITTGTFIASMPCTHVLLLMGLDDTAFIVGMLSVYVYVIFSVLTTAAWMAKSLIGFCRRR